MAGSPPTDRDQAFGLTHLRVFDDYLADRAPMNYQGSRLRICRAHSSAAEHLLCKEEALGSNPSGSIRRARFEPCPLSVGRRSNLVRRQMHHPG